MLRQRTLKKSISTKGVGLHTGARVEIALLPAPAEAGIVFRRTDLPTPVSIPARADRVGDTRLSSTLKGDGATVSTVEHLMSALAGLGIDNLRVDIAGPEVPIMDGSAMPFVYLLQSAGVVEQDAPKRFIRVEGGSHHNLSAVAGDEYRAALRELFRNAPRTLEATGLS